ncbi:hypothetical protein EJB05_21314, partial [Eragrostis curvula]
MDAEETATKAPPALRSPFMWVFMNADAVDVALMLLGLVGAMGDGMSLPVMLILFIRITNDLGRTSSKTSAPGSTRYEREEPRLLGVRLLVHGVPRGVLLACWARTAERQASRMRTRYLRAVLRQDMEYFDLTAGTTSEVVTSVSSDSLVVQDALGEKLPNFLMNATMFVSSYAFGFLVLWRFTLVAQPSVLLLVIPGIVYGRVLDGIARRIREQYARPGAVAEQAVSSACTVYAFVAEASTTAQFSAALEESARLGIKEGLAKGVAVGSNAVTLAIWAFNICYVFGFAVLWRLTLVALPSVLLLVIPGIVYGRVLDGIARRVREQYSRPGAVAEQAVSSTRTAFVAEASTTARFDLRRARGVSAAWDQAGARHVPRLPGRHRLRCLVRHRERRLVRDTNTHNSVLSNNFLEVTTVR